jgi:hypothetical protein
MSLSSPYLRVIGRAYLYYRGYIQPQLREKRISRAALDGHAETEVYYALVGVYFDWLQLNQT